MLRLFPIAFLALLLLAPAQGQHVRTSISGSNLGKLKSTPVKKRRMTDENLRKAAIQAGPMRPEFDQSHRRNFPDPKTQGNRPSPGAYPWHFDITATYFYATNFYYFRHINLYSFRIKFLIR